MYSFWLGPLSWGQDASIWQFVSHSNLNYCAQEPSEMARIMLYSYSTTHLERHHEEE